MRKLKFLSSLISFVTFTCFCGDIIAAVKPYYYQLKIYHMASADQEQRVETYLKDAYLPALHKAGIANIGVFKPIDNKDNERLIYVFIPFKNIADFTSIDQKLNADKEYQVKGKDYLAVIYNNPNYIRIESILSEAFTGMPSPAIPKLTAPKQERVYEYRSYESATEALLLNKIGMFNDEEVKMFNDLNFNTLFYARVISGTTMPNLIYMTSFNNMADRDKHWEAFGMVYKKISNLPKYKNNVSKNVTIFLKPLDFSDF